MKDPLTKTEVQAIAKKAVQQMLKSDSTVERIIMQMIRNGLIQYNKSIYTRRGFWSSDIRNVGT